MSGKDSVLETDEAAVIETASSPALKEGKEEKVQSSARAEVVVFDNWCKGCGLCVAFCPRGVLKVNGDGKVHVAAPERCTACHWCDTHCPDFAIIVRRVDETLGRGRDS